ncbi:MAG: hypothetical protein GY754_24805 [bacterium]|nr:hypothetical protein [bacterium]
MGSAGIKLLPLCAAITVLIVFILISVSIDAASIHYAAKKGDRTIMNMLLDIGIHVDTRDIEGLTPLSHALYNNQMEIARLLVKKGADVNVKDTYGMTPLYWAIKAGNTPGAAFLIEKGASINIIDSYDKSPLLEALIKGTQESARLLLEKGAKVNLLEAVLLEDEDTVSSILNKGGDINTKDTRGNSVLHWAVSYCKIKIIRLLLNKGTLVNTRNKAGKSPLDLAIHGYQCTYYKEIVKILKEKDALTGTQILLN